MVRHLGKESENLIQEGTTQMQKVAQRGHLPLLESRLLDPRLRRDDAHWYPMGLDPREWLRILSFLFVLCFAFSSIVEARQTKTARQTAVAQRKAVAVKGPQVRTAPTKAISSRVTASKARSQRVVAARKPSPPVVVARQRVQTRSVGNRPVPSRGRTVGRSSPQVVARQTPQTRSVASKPTPARGRFTHKQQRSPIHAAPSLPPVMQQPISQPVVVKASAPLPAPIPITTTVPLPVKMPVSTPTSIQTPLVVKASEPIPILLPAPAPVPVKAPVAPPPTYLSQLKPHTQRNVQIMGLPTLYDKGLFGQGQTIAAVDLSGTWDRDAMNSPLNSFSREKRESYRNNFLSSIGGPDLHPEEQNAWIRSTPYGTHGGEVASVPLDLAPHAKVLPVSTYNTPGSPVRYDVADAVMDVAQRPDVNIINISAGDIHATSESKEIQDEHGHFQIVCKSVYIPKLAEAFKRAAQAGQVVVFGSGNNGLDVQAPQFVQTYVPSRGEVVGHLIEALDPETLESVIFAGNLDPDTRMASKSSNKPGNWEAAQKKFLFAPGSHELSYLPDFVVKGTSFAAPAICSAIAALCSKPGITPKIAAKALLETAEERPEKHIYGRGVSRADKALEWLESRGY